ncbi:glutathione S-transferas-like protein [Ophiobolus disseminans]|uniref:Glutathione S-transferas-like protein n=1 Tax=Ophiobolus disseminans TaxID=1469910 RepID=A0A6A7AJZ4_9PLEO|nr:glutathione S-transferas-like protein [Ophiobolus disseminans]
MSEQVIFYDLANQQGTAWSLNPWKTRLILNYKNIPYKTEWIEYPDLAPKLQALGIPPNDPSAPGYFTPYSSPAIRYASGSCGMDSWPIAHELEKQYPSPSLHLDDPIVVQMRDHVSNIMKPLVAHLLPKVPDVILNPVSAKYFNDTRAQVFGMTLQEMERTMATEQAWEDAKPPAREVGKWLRMDGAGPFFLGKTVSYADFILVAFFQMLKRIGQSELERYLALDEAFPKVYEACGKWLEKED